MPTGRYSVLPLTLERYGTSPAMKFSSVNTLHEETYNHLTWNNEFWPTDYRRQKEHRDPKRIEMVSATSS